MIEESQVDLVDATDTACDGIARFDGDPAAIARLVEVRPESLVVNIANLNIRVPNQEGFAAGFMAEILINGRPFPVRSLDLHIAVDDVISAKIEFFPHSIA